MKPTEKTKKNSSKVSSRLSLGERVPKLRFPGFEGEWEEYKLETFMSSRDERQVPSNDVPLMAFIANIGVSPKGDRYDREYLVKSKDKEYKKTEFNDFIYSSNNLDVGSIGLNKYGTAVISDVYEIFAIKEGYAPNFISELIQRPHNLYKVLRFRQGCLYGQYRIYATDFLNVVSRAPHKDEQHKISAFLSLLDSRIAAQRKLVELLKKHKRGLSNALFSGKVRIATNAKWRTYRLGDIVRRVTRKNGKATDIPLTISAQHGLIDQREFFSKAVASADMSGYYLLKQGEFAYNRSSSSEYPFGSIKKLERYHQGAVSTLYICFETLGDKDDAEFLKWYFDSFAWHREIGMICAEGARNHGLLNVPTDGFFDTKHILPSDKDERKKIASLMALADARCECAETELDRLTAIKSGLLQQMFV